MRIIWTLLKVIGLMVCCGVVGAFTIFLLWSVAIFFVGVP